MELDLTLTDPLLPEPPDYLSEEAAELWNKFQEQHNLVEPQQIEILTRALEAFDRMREAQAILRAEGIVIRDRFDQPKQHPATLIERDNRAAMIAALTKLGLNLEPLRSGPGRPPRSEQSYLEGF